MIKCSLVISPVFHQFCTAIFLFLSQLKQIDLGICKMWYFLRRCCHYLTLSTYLLHCAQSDAILKHKCQRESWVCKAVANRVVRTQEPDAHLSVRVQGFELVRASAQNPNSGVDGASTVLGLCALASSVNAA